MRRKLMLSIIPAVLMLVLNGPAGVEGSVAEGRLSHALRAWACRQLGQTELVQEETAASPIEALLSLGQDFPELSRFLTEVFQFSADFGVSPNRDPYILPHLPGPERSPATQRCTALEIPLECQRSRDGPARA